MAARNVKETKVYKLAFELSMDIFNITRFFPNEERYSLISQIRRSSRSVCSNLIETYREKRYVNHFVAKVTDSDMENSETSGWLDFSLSCGYIDEDTFKQYSARNEEIGRLLNHMIDNAEKY